MNKTYTKCGSTEPMFSRRPLLIVAIAIVLVSTTWAAKDCSAQTSYQRLSDGTLFVVGDSSDTNLKFSKPYGTPSGYLRVKETPSPGSLTRYRHFYNINDVIVDLGDGNNSLQFFYWTDVRGSLTVMGGDDADAISLHGTVDGDLYVDMGDGANGIRCDSFSVELDATIVGGCDRDTVESIGVPFTVYGRTEFHLDKGSDFFRVDTGDFHGSTLIDAGPGRDNIMSDHTDYEYTSAPQFRGHTEIILGPDNESNLNGDRLNLVSCDFHRNLNVRIGQIGAEITIGEQESVVPIGEDGSVTVGVETKFSAHPQANTSFEISNFRSNYFMEIDGGMTDHVRIRNSSFFRDGFRVLLGEGSDNFEIDFATSFQPSYVRGGTGALDVFTGLSGNPSRLTIVGFERFYK